MRLGIEVGHTDGAARRGVVRTVRGEVQTPVFMPVGTRGAIRSLTTDSLGQLAAPGHEQVFERLVLEVQRSLDHFDRQFSYLTVARLLVAPGPVAGLQQYLADNLYLPVQAMDLSQALDLSAAPGLRDPVQQGERLHLLGAALRQEAVA